MRIIAHRANLYGPDEKNENSPAQILRAIDAGFDVEIDVRIVGDTVMLGHDYPQYDCPEKFLISIIEKSWFHCKDIQSMVYLSSKFPGIKYFWHQEDDFTLTSNGYIWTFPGKEITKKSILVLPETQNKDLVLNSLSKMPYGICTDWPYEYKN